MLSQLLTLLIFTLVATTAVANTLSTEASSSYKALLWSLGLGLSRYENSLADRKIQASFNGNIVFKYSFNDFLKIKIEPKLNFKNGYVHNYSASAADSISISFSEASTTFDSSNQILLNLGSFTGVAAFPTNSTLSSQSQVNEKTTSLFAGGIRWESKEDVFAKIQGMYYRLSNLPEHIVNDLSAEIEFLFSKHLSAKIAAAGIENHSNRIGYHGGVEYSHRSNFKIKFSGGLRQVPPEAPSQNRDRFASIGLETPYAQF